MAQTMKFLVVEPFPLSILITLGPKYSPQDPVSLNVRDYFPQPYSTTGNIIVLCTLIFKFYTFLAELVYIGREVEEGTGACASESVSG
jgi:hypothetical protein